MDYNKTLKNKWFNLILSEKKTIEGRLNKDEFSLMNIGDTITFTNKDNLNTEPLKKIIKNITKYSSFKALLEDGNNFSKCLPTIKTIEEGCEIYYSYYSKDDENIYGVLAIEI